jgi:predicted nucleic acid-binding protein
MSFLLDTDICSAQLKNVWIVNNRFLQYGGQLFASTVTVAELQAWLLCGILPTCRESPSLIG